MKRLFMLWLLFTSTVTVFGQILGPILFGGTSGTSGLVSTPSFSPNPAYFFVGGSVSITITDTTPGSYICYATSPTVPVPDGSGGCSTGTLYSTALSESSALTLNAVAGASGYANSLTASDVVAQSALVLQIQMADGSGTTATDSCCGDNFTITAGTGGWTTQSGLANGAYSFDGTTTRMDGANHTNLDFERTNTFSIAAFFSTSLACSGEQGLFSKWNSVGSAGYAFEIQCSSSLWLPWVFLVNTYSTSTIEVHANSGCSISINALHSLIVTYSGSSTAAGVKFYLDGSLCTNTAVHDNLTTSILNTLNPRIGMRNNGVAIYKGKIGPVYVWNRVLTSGEASALNSSPYAPPN